MALGLIFGGCIILIYQKMKLQSKNYEILNKQKLRKNTHAEMSYERTRKNSFYIVIVFASQKKIFEKDGIHRIKAV